MLFGKWQFFKKLNQKKIPSTKVRNEKLAHIEGMALLEGDTHHQIIVLGNTEVIDRGKQNQFKKIDF